MYSLAQHSDARMAGEVFCVDDHLAGVDWSSDDDPQPVLDQFNLFKLLGIYYRRPHFDRFRNLGVMVYLYRRDTEAQIRSWQKASESGKWLSEYTPIAGQPFDIANALDEIRTADMLFLRDAQLAIAFETLTEHWHATIRTILDLAGWPQQTLPMATKPTAKV